MALVSHVGYTAPALQKCSISILQIHGNDDENVRDALEIVKTNITDEAPESMRRLVR